MFSLLVLFCHFFHFTTFWVLQSVSKKYQHFFDCFLFQFVTFAFYNVSFMTLRTFSSYNSFNDSLRFVFTFLKLRLLSNPFPCFLSQLLFAFKIYLVHTANTPQYDSNKRSLAFDFTKIVEHYLTFQQSPP